MNDRLIPAQRQQELLDYLDSHQFLKLTEISDVMGVSESTIRRDLDKLEKDGLVERTHGGALLSKKMRVEPTYSSSEKSFPAEKTWIGAAAAQLVESGETIFLGSGSTTAQIIRHLNQRENLQDVTLVTNNIQAALQTEHPEIQVILLGGQLRVKAGAVGGRFALNNLGQVYADKAFIGADGLSFKYGCASPVGREAAVSRQMIQRTHGQSVLVADHSKWGVVCNYPFADLEDFSIFITDYAMDDDTLSEIRGRIAKVLVCSAEGVRE